MTESDALVESISDDAPCGPDLVAAGDPAFLTFRDRIEALCPARIPGGRMIREDGLPFDAREIRLRDETKVISALLERSRDLRFLVLRARLHLLTGDLQGFANAIALAASLLDERWDEVHPEDVAERRIEFESFEPPIAGPIPLQFVPLLRDRRADVIRFRHFLIATGEAQRPDGETTPDEATIRAALAAPANEAAVTNLRSALAGVRESCEAVKARFAAHGAAPPQMKAFLGTVARIAALVDEVGGGRPKDHAAPVAGGTVLAEGKAGARLPELPVLATVPIGDHGEAAAALLAAEA